MCHPHGRRTECDPGGRSLAELTRPALVLCRRSILVSVPSSRFPTQRKAGVGGDWPGPVPDRDLFDDVACFGIDDSDVVRVDGAEPAGRIPRGEEDDGREHSYKGEPSSAENRRAAPKRPRANRGLGGLRELRLVAKRRERGGESVSLSLVEPDRTVEVLQTLVAEVAQEDVQIFLLVLEQRLRRL